MFTSSLPCDKLPIVYMQVSFADIVSALVNHVASSTSAILKTIVICCPTPPSVIRSCNVELTLRLTLMLCVKINHAILPSYFYL